MARKTYSADDIDIHFDGSRCIHARNCVLRLPSVFHANAKGPWIDPTGATPEEIAAMARTCPSGAITYTRKDGVKNEEIPPVNTIRMQENGPLEMRGDLRLKGESIGTRAVICRCGMSKNKPFCDGTHVKGRFKASGERPMQAREELEQTDGPLTLDPQENGPMHVTGNLEIIAGSGARIAQDKDVWLCRCGHSSNKPYCDGSHRDAKFRAPG